MTNTTALEKISQDSAEEAHVAAGAFLARYSGRTLDAYRYDLRYFFQWANHVCLDVLAATRSHIETYRCAMEQRGLATSTARGSSPRSAASTASPTSTAASLRTPPSTSVGPRTTTIYDRRRQNFDRHAAYVVVAFVAGG